MVTELILRDGAALNEGEDEDEDDAALEEPELATVWAEEPETVVAVGALVLVVPKPEEVPGMV
jgi:hypothetical protein